VVAGGAAADDDNVVVVGHFSFSVRELQIPVRRMRAPVAGPRTSAKGHFGEPVDFKKSQANSPIFTDRR
jgi:hypothetical protein